MKSLFFSSLFICAAAMSDGRSEHHLKSGGNVLLKAGQEAYVTCEATKSASRDATVFEGTATYVGANCKNIKAYGKNVKVTTSIVVSTNSVLDCNDTWYYLGISVPLTGDTLERVMIKKEDLIFEN